MSVISVFKYVSVYSRWHYVRQLLTALAWSSAFWAYRTSNTENSYSVWQVFLYCSILCQEVPSQFLWSHTYLQRILASKLKRSCEFTVKKELGYTILFLEYLISTKSVSPACPFVGMKYIKISEIIIILIGINIIIIGIIISCYCTVVLYWLSDIHNMGLRYNLKSCSFPSLFNFVHYFRYLFECNIQQYWKQKFHLKNRILHIFINFGGTESFKFHAFKTLEI
jgi:hypothetical protein